MTIKKRRFSGDPLELLTALAFVLVVGLSLTAQSPAPGAPAPAPQAPAQPAPAQGGAGGGRGAQVDPTLPIPDFTKQPPVLPVRPEEEAKQFILQPGYRMELVLADPDIKDPTSINF